MNEPTASESADASSDWDRAQAASLPRIALAGRMGIGKTTALRTLCGHDLATTDVPNLDREAHVKEFTTVGAEFGDIELGSGERIQVCGCPGQERFSFLRQWVLSVSLGVFVMVDVREPEDVEEAMRILLDVQAQKPSPPLALVLSTRPATGEEREAFAQALAQRGLGVIPVLQADPRKREDLLNALSVLVSLLSLEGEQK